MHSKLALIVLLLLAGFAPAADALAEVNAARAKRGLPAFINDPGLAQGAEACAQFRAAHRMEKHTGNDFSFLPSGSFACAGGCAALEPSFGWAACCSWENWKYAGAAVVMGSDGRRYMEIFVKNEGQSCGHSASESSSFSSGWPQGSRLRGWSRWNRR